MHIRFYGCVGGLALGMAALLLAAHSVTLADAGSAPSLQTLPSPGGAGSSEPQITGRGDHVVLSWLETRGEHATVKFATYAPAGWSTPKTVVSGDNFFVNSFDVPSVLETAEGTFVGQWLQQSGSDPDSDAYDIRLSWSRDQGRTWSRPTSPHHDGTKTQHGFVSMFQTPGSGLGLVWLDGRATNPETETGNMALRASLYDQQGKQLREMVISSRVCDCCNTSTAGTADGVIVAYRNRSDTEIRDIYVSRFAGGQWSKGIPVHDDGWRIRACPINGPSVSARGRDVAVAWFTGKDNQGKAYLAFSHDAGQTFGAPTRVDDVSTRGRLAVQLLEDGSAAVAWIEVANGHTQLQFRMVTAQGQRSAPVTVSKTETGIPRLADAGKNLLFAWTESNGGASQVRTAYVAIGRK